MKYNLKDYVNEFGPLAPTILVPNGSNSPEITNITKNNIIVFKIKL